MSNGKVNLLDLLPSIPVDSCSYQEWLEVGMALKYEGFDLAVWDSWSQGDSRYVDGECERKWNGFNGSDKPVTGATVTALAKRVGWKPKRDNTDRGYALDWDSTIGVDQKVIDTDFIEREEFSEPDSDWKPIEDMKKFLRTLFHDDEIVGYVGNVRTREDGRFVPLGAGTYSYTAGSLCRKLDHYTETERKRHEKTGEPISISDIIGQALSCTLNEEAGMWVRINPLDGHGAKDENVTDYRYTLIESDSMDIEKQIAIIKSLRLPVATLTYSGNKSVHAVVKVEANDYTDYKDRVRYVQSVCEKNGLQVDGGNKNPSRLSRLPGVFRNGHKQFLIDTNIGEKTFEEWKDYIEGVNDDLPDIESLADEWESLPPLSPVIIDGILRENHKMMISGPSKAGKSFLLMELCVAFAEGKEWLGHHCKQGKVLYVNLEIDRPSCLHRFKDIYDSLGYEEIHPGNIEVWNLRGSALPLDQLVPKLIRRAKDRKFVAIVIDPIYKVITGDENAAGDMARFCNNFDRLCKSLNCAAVYCHHHSKGAQGGKKAMDRASGSGVFARDPDALLDITPLTVVNEDSTIEENAGAFRMSGIIREFPPLNPINMYFRWPVHKVDDTGLLAMAAEEGSQKSIQDIGRGRANQDKKERKEKRKEEMVSVFKELCSFNGSDNVSTEEMAERMDISVRTIERYIKEIDELKLKGGYIFSEMED